MNAGLGLMPFPSLGKINNEDLPDLIRCMELEVDLKLDKVEAGRFWVATLIFLGLKFDKEFIEI